MAKISWNTTLKGDSISLSNENLTAEVLGGSNYSTRYIKSQEPITTGKHYMELRLDSVVESGTWRILFGVAEENAVVPTNGVISSPNVLKYGHSDIPVKSGDVIGISINMDDKNIGFYKEGLLQGSFENYAGNNAVILVMANTNGMKWTANFGATSFRYKIPVDYYPYDKSQNNVIFNKILLLSDDGKIKSFKKGGYTDSIIPIMTSSTSSDPYIASASTGSFPWRAFSEESYWITTSGRTTGWLQIDLGVNNEMKIEKYSIESETNYSRSPSDWAFEGSNDSVLWDILDQQSGVSNWEANEVKEFTFNNNSLYRYYRINVSKNAGHSNYLSIARLRVMERLNSNIIQVSSQSEEDFINHGMSPQELSEIDFSSSFTEKHYIQDQSTPLGSGKVFEQPLDVDKIIKSVKLT